MGERAPGAAGVTAVVMSAGPAGATGKAGGPTLLQSACAALLMAVAMAASMVLTPTRGWYEHIGQPPLESAIPHRFGDWEDTGRVSLSLVNPEQVEQLRIIYNQTVTRTYVHRPTGRVLMLSVALGTDQAYATQLHRPEMCYLAQGFTIDRNTATTIESPDGPLPVTQLHTHAGARNEPVTYWVRTGSRVTQGSLQMNLERIALAFSGWVADGLLFRVSEITRDDESSLQLQRQFLTDLLRAVPSADRQVLTGTARPWNSGPAW